MAQKLRRRQIGIWYWFLRGRTIYHYRSSKQVPADGAHDADGDDDVEHERQNVCSGLRKDATLHRRQHKHYSFHNYLTCGRQLKRKIGEEKNN